MPRPGGRRSHSPRSARWRDGGCSEGCASGYEQIVPLYPELRGPRARALTADIASIVLLILFAWAGLKVHDAVDRTPVVGGEIADGLRSAGESSGGEVVGLGEEGEDSAHDLANLLGLVTFALPAVLVLALWLPGRVDQVKRLRDASEVLGDHDSTERRRLLAMRAAFSLPYGQLLAYTPDPMGDLASERYDALVAAALEDAGLRAEPAQSIRG